jgi:hypothetical protein
MVLCVAAAIVAAFRGTRYVYAEDSDAADAEADAELHHHGEPVPERASAEPAASRYS